MSLQGGQIGVVFAGQYRVDADRAAEMGGYVQGFDHGDVEEAVGHGDAGRPLVADRVHDVVPLAQVAEDERVRVGRARRHRRVLEVDEPVVVDDRRAGRAVHREAYRQAGVGGRGRVQHGQRPGGEPYGGHRDVLDLDALV